MLSNVVKLALNNIFRTFKKTALPCWSWRSSSSSDSDRTWAVEVVREGLDLSNFRFLILNGRTSLDRRMAGLSQKILVRKTSLPTPHKLIRCRRTLEPGQPKSRISTDFIGRFLTSISLTKVSSYSIWISPLVADEEPRAVLITL